MKLFWRFLKIAIEKQNQYKIEYFYAALLLLTNIVFMPIMWFFLTDGGTQSLSGWRFGGLAVLSILYAVLISLADILGIWDALWLVSSDVGRRQLTTYFSKPIHPIIMIYGQGIMPSGILKFALAIVAFAAYAIYFQLNISLAFFLLVFFGAIIWLNMHSYPILMMISYELSAKPLIRVMYSFLRYSELPLTHLEGAASLITSFIVPIAFIVAVPAESLLYEPSFEVILIAGAMAVMTSLVSVILWEFTKRKYEAVGE